MNTITKVIFNKNGNWIISSGRDQVVKLYDIRIMKELSVFKSHQTEV
jgi:polyadenylation factor subunit 2